MLKIRTKNVTDYDICQDMTTDEILPQRLHKKLTSDSVSGSVLDFFNKWHEIGFVMSGFEKLH